MKKARVKQEENEDEEIVEDQGQVEQKVEGKIKVRQNFDPLAHFTASATTNEAGLVSIPIELPDTITRYKIFAFATGNPFNGKDTNNLLFGTGEHNVAVQLPLTIRPSHPNFLYYQDNSTIDILVQNITPVPMVTKLAIRQLNSFSSFLTTEEKYLG